MNLPRPSSPYVKAQLVVSLNRLFIVEYTRLDTRSGGRWERQLWVTLCIWEIVLTKREVVKVADIMRKFQKYSKSLLEELGEVMGETVVAGGCVNAIVFSFVDGCRMKFNLLERRWYELLPFSPCFEYGSVCKGICSGF